MYALEPISIGTAMSESLSSYLIRLAEAHSVGVGDFVGRLLLEIPNPIGAIVTPAAQASRERVATDFALVDMPSMALPIEQQRGCMCLRRQLDVVISPILPFFRSALHCHSKYFDAIGHGARLVLNTGGRPGRPFMNPFVGHLSCRPAVPYISVPSAILVLIAIGALTQSVFSRGSDSASTAVSGSVASLVMQSQHKIVQPVSGNSGPASRSVSW